MGAYRIIELIGQGAIGLVFLAEHTKLKRRVALKVLREELASNPSAVNRFFGEARAVNAIAHENIVEITDFVEADWDIGVPSHYIMELLEGLTLREVLELQRLPIDRTVDIGLQIAAALDAVHGEQIVHRDLKPANIFVASSRGRTDFVKVLDFGVAKLSTALIGGDPNTGSGMLLGTPGYMAPEQIYGMPVDHRTDLYALGVVLFEMAAGRPPFENDGMLELLALHCESEPPAPASVARPGEPIPAELSALILECLKKNPDDRPDSASEILERLSALRDRRLRHRRAAEAAEARAGSVVRSLRRLGPTALAIVLTGAGIALVGASGDPASAPGAPVVPASAIAAPPIAALVVPPSVAISFDSEPPGAEVRRGTELLGRTPFSRAFDRTERSETFSFSTAKHQTEDVEIALTGDAHVKVVLERRPRRSPPARPIEEAETKLGPILEGHAHGSIRRRGSMIHSLVALLVLASSTPGAPAEAVAPGRRDFERAQHHYNLGEFDEALRLFRSSYDAAPRAEILFDIGQCHRNLGDNLRAIFFFQRYLEEHPTGADADGVRALLAELRSDGEVVSYDPPPLDTATVAPGRFTLGVSLITMVPPPEPRPLAERWWFWAALMGAAALTAGSIVLVASATDGDRASFTPTPVFHD